MYVRFVRVALVLGVFAIASCTCARAQDQAQPAAPVQGLDATPLQGQNNNVPGAQGALPGGAQGALPGGAQGALPGGAQGALPGGAPLAGGPVAGGPVAGGPVGGPIGGGFGGPCCGPVMRTIQCIECVPVPCTVKRICYRTVCREQCYTAYRCVCVPVTRTCNYTVWCPRPVCKQVCRTIWCQVPCTVNQTVLRPFHYTKTITTMQTRCVDRGHWVCVPHVARCATFCQNLKYRCSRGTLCCDPCNPCCCVRCKGCPPPPVIRYRKQWCPCIVRECVPCTRCVTCCEMRPCVVPVTICKCVPRQITCNVTCWTCVPKVCCRTYTCFVQQTVPYQCKRLVSCCVPYETCVTCVRYVPRVVCRQVPCAPCCCCECCCTPCGRHHRCGRAGLMGRCGHRNTCCNVGCGGGCY